MGCHIQSVDFEWRFHPQCEDRATTISIPNTHTLLLTVDRNWGIASGCGYHTQLPNSAVLFATESVFT